MTDLQLGLLVIGAVAIGGVLVYNRVQERAAKRRIEAAFGSRHADPLLDSEAARREPGLSNLPHHTDRAAAVPTGTLPDERFDYVIELAPTRRVSAAEALGHWSALEHRFAKRVLLAAHDEGAWRRLLAGDTGRCTTLRAGLQLASRDGAVGEAELLEFRSSVDTLGNRLGASVSAPDMRAALEAARELDALCADADVQVALHVVAPPDAPFPQTAAASVAGSAQGGVFQVEVHGAKAAGIESITLTMDVPRVPDVVRGFEAMARAGAELAASLGGRLVDDNQSIVDERALEAIARELDAMRQRLAERGIEPGGELALRLFS